jgi:hypothetical protein
MEASGQPHAPAALPPGKNPMYPMNRWLELIRLGLKNLGRNNTKWLALMLYIW